MLKVIKNFEQSSLAWVLFGFSALYLTVAFPFSFFRHDDWLMIGNVARIIPNHWKFIFEPYLIFNSVPEVWFFRPWFKLILYLLYHTFGLQYYGWLAVNLLLTVGALVFGYLTIADLTRSRLNALIFVLFFVFSVHFHFASLVWVGEGTMNCPQIFLLFLNFYLYNKAFNSVTPKKGIIFYGLSIFIFILSLGFKEAAIFHLPFLLLILFNKANGKNYSLTRKIKFLIPYFILACIYLYFRLFLVPFNPGYKPRGDWTWFLIPFFFICAAFLIPLFSMVIGAASSKVYLNKCLKEILLRGGYFVFFIPFFITYMGHGFFSPGWLLAPGFYFTFVLGLTFPSTLLNHKFIATSLVFTCIVSSGLVFYQTHNLSWWSWHRPQRQILEIIKGVATSETQTIQIYNCEQSEKNNPHLHRVVGYSDSIQEIFWLAHKKLPTVNVLPCENMQRSLASAAPNTLSLKWSFPEFTVLVN